MSLATTISRHFPAARLGVTTEDGREALGRRCLEAGEDVRVRVEWDAHRRPASESPSCAASRESRWMRVCTAGFPYRDEYGVHEFFPGKSYAAPNSDAVRRFPGHFGPSDHPYGSRVMARRLESQD